MLPNGNLPMHLRGSYLHNINAGVLKAVANVNDKIAPALIKENIDVKDQAKVDNFLNKLDGTQNKTNLGANAILGVSMAVAKAAAAEKVGRHIFRVVSYLSVVSPDMFLQGVPLYVHISDLAGTKKPYVLPVPFMNVLNGGSHAGGRMPLQEFMIVPWYVVFFMEPLSNVAELKQ